ncbi:hypothetical protein BASA50_006890 [Batrachochytrium salamandrivorans]|uniref:CBM21 domain-containing protein n=1 Tax=Batrachochytrium salamandrivorans TaxID=1357716 RepID=A0ABQ8F8F3_9FUNG|nr:hypothetical protein BASA62_002003 [Batrachochytrium salamandrivorans]KAH6593980.1 hypothetical protein BASA50_006890 [Batrachochytrium salamandrivorans]KAJ1344752.1 hypothetical protein BSLG_000273 [Batrachochytrium salamandrivorans]
MAIIASNRCHPQLILASDPSSILGAAAIRNKALLMSNVNSSSQSSSNTVIITNASSNNARSITSSDAVDDQQQHSPKCTTAPTRASPPTLSAYFSPSTIEQVCLFDSTQPPASIRSLPVLLVADNKDVDCCSVSSALLSQGHSSCSSPSTSWSVSSNLALHPCFNGRPLMLESLSVDGMNSINHALPAAIPPASTWKTSAYSTRPSLGQDTALSSSSFAAPVIHGSVLVRNISFDKHVFLRMTSDHWKTHRDVLCRFDGVVSPSMADFVGVDRFCFSVELDSPCVAAMMTCMKQSLAASEASSSSSSSSSSASQLPPFKIEQAFCFRANGIDYWDNNSGSNFVLSMTPPNADAVRKLHREQLHLHKLHHLHLQKTLQKNAPKRHSLQLKSLLKIRPIVASNNSTSSNPAASLATACPPHSRSLLHSQLKAQSSRQAIPSHCAGSIIRPISIHHPSTAVTTSATTAVDDSAIVAAVTARPTLRSSFFQSHRRVAPIQHPPPIVKIPLFTPPVHDHMVPVTISLTTGAITSKYAVSPVSVTAMDVLYSSSPPSCLV